MKISLIGCVSAFMSIVTYSSNLRTVNKMRTQLDQGIGKLNPYQLLYSVHSNLIWLVYGFMLKNWYVLIERIFGATLYIYYVISCIGLLAISYGKMSVTISKTAEGPLRDMYNQDLKRLNTVQFVLIFIILFWMIMFSLMFVGYEFSADTVGTMCMVVTQGYYIMRTPHLYIIARSKNASTIIPQLMVMDMLLCVSWFLYGLSVQNMNFVYPNAVGVVYSSAYVVLYLLYKNHKPSPATMEEQNFLISEESKTIDGGSHIELTTTVLSSADSTSSASTDPRRERGVHAAVDSLAMDGVSDCDEMSYSTVQSQIGLPLEEQEVSGTGSDTDTATGTGTATLLSGAVGLLDSGMEYLANIGRSRSNTLSIDPTTETCYNLEEMHESLTQPDLTIDHCSSCSCTVVADATYCWNCGLVVSSNSLQPRKYSMYGSASAPVSTSAVEEGLGTHGESHFHQLTGMTHVDSAYPKEIRSGQMDSVISISGGEGGGDGMRHRICTITETEED